MDMKCFSLWCGLAVLVLAVGCDQAMQNAQQAANQTATEVTDAAQAAGTQAQAAVEGAATDLSSLKVGDVDLGKDLSSLLEGLNGTLGEVKDVETAQTALPKLEEASLGLDKLLGFVDQLPEVAKPVLASLLKTHTATITQSVQKVVGIEGVGAILKPVLDQIVAKLNNAGGGEAAAAP
jgi:phage-related minor tail protein